MDHSLANDFLDVLHRIGRIAKQRPSLGDLPRSEFFLLNVIDVSGSEQLQRNNESAKHGHVSVTELAKMLGVTTAAVSRLLRTVESKGYIERKTDDSDRRFVYIELSEKGRELLLASRKAAQLRVISALGKMNPDDARVLLQLLQQLLDTMQTSELPQPLERNTDTL